jgi:hypothetical protein
MQRCKGGKSRTWSTYLARIWDYIQVKAEVCLPCSHIVTDDIDRYTPSEKWDLVRISHNTLRVGSFSGI